MKPSFKYIFDKYFKRLCFMAVRYVGDEYEGEDIVSQLMMRLWQRWDNFGPEEEKIKAWLYISLRNACFNHIKLLKRTSSNRLHLLEESEASIEANIIHAEVLNEIYACIEKLPPKCRKVCIAWLNVKHYGGHAEIIEKLKISKHTYWCHVQKATNLIKMQLGLPYAIHFADSDFYRKKKIK